VKEHQTIQRIIWQMMMMMMMTMMMRAPPKGPLVIVDERVSFL